MLGHSEIGVTQRYAHLAPTALKLAGAETERAIVSLRAARRGAESDDPTGHSQVTGGASEGGSKRDDPPRKTELRPRHDSNV